MSHPEQDNFQHQESLKNNFVQRYKGYYVGMIHATVGSVVMETALIVEDTLTADGRFLAVIPTFIVGAKITIDGTVKALKSFNDRQ